MFKFIGSSPNKPAWSTFTNASSREDFHGHIILCPGNVSISEHSKSFIKNVNHLRNTQIKFPNDAVLLGWYFETLPIQVKDSDAASTMVTSGTNLIWSIGRLNEEVIYKQSLVTSDIGRNETDATNKFYSVLDSYVPVKEVKINQIQNYRFNNSNSQNSASGFKNQDGSNGQSW